VVVPALSRLQNDPERFRRYYLKAIMAISAVGMPLVVLLFVFAEDVVLLLLGPQWGDAVPLFRILAPAAFIEPFNVIGSWAHAPFGRSAPLLRWQLVATPVMAASFLAGAQWGVVGVAVGFTLASLILRTLGMVYLLKQSPVRPAQILRALISPAASSLSAGVLVAIIRALFLMDLDAPARLLIGVPIFGLVVVLAWFVIPGGRLAVAELRDVARDLLGRRPDPGS
jgi:PST family polysaccharide transporter